MNDARKKEGILVADGDHMVRDYLTSCMEDQGFYVKAVGDGVEAVLLFIREADRFDAALIDISLTGLNGLNVLRIIKALDPGFPVLILTGRVEGERELESAALACGAGDILSKPFEPGHLQELIRTIVSR